MFVSMNLYFPHGWSSTALCYIDLDNLWRVSIKGWYKIVNCDVLNTIMHVEGEVISREELSDPVGINAGEGRSFGIEYAHIVL